MHGFNDPLITAWQLVAGADARLAGIVLLSLRVSLSATLIACVAGMPIGALLAVGRFPGRRALIVLFNGLMGLPPVVVGLLVYLLLSRAGPLGQKTGAAPLSRGCPDCPNPLLAGGQGCTA